MILCCHEVTKTQRINILVFLCALVAMEKLCPKTHAQKKAMSYKPLSKREETIAEKIVDAAYTVHKTLGPGLLEKVYEVCFCHELSKRGLKYKRQVDIPIVYDGMTFDERCSGRGACYL